MRIGVLFGGDSPEREVSLRSGAAVCAALGELPWKVCPLEVREAGEVLSLLDEADFFFVALHGGWGEDGRLQALLEMAGKAYSGSGPEACFCAMDKEVSKALFRERGVATPPGFTLGEGERLEGGKDPRADALFRLGTRVVVKPARCGSTVGVSVVDAPCDLARAVDDARRFDEKVIVEAFIEGRELTVTLLEEEGEVRALPVVEILPASGFYSYEAKYTAGASLYETPAVLSAREEADVSSAARAAHRALDCRVYSRVDLRLDGKGRPFVLEVNTAPGMTATSLVPKAARAAGMAFSELLRRIVEEARSRRRR